MRPGMRHPPPVPPLRPPQRLMPAPNDGGVFFGGRDYARRQQQQQQQQQQNYPPQKPLLPQGNPTQPWPNNPNYRPGPVPLLRPNGPWHPHGNAYHSQSPPPPLLPPHPQPFNPNVQTPITYVPPPATTYELMRIANPEPVLLADILEEDETVIRPHLSSNSNTDESLSINTTSPSKPNKRRRQQQQQQQQHENNRNMISYQDLDRPEEQTFDNRLVSKASKTNHLPSDKTNNQIPSKSSLDNDQALKLELDRIKRAGAQEREKLRAQRQAAAEKEKEAQIKRNSAKTGDKEKREDGELGDSSDDENPKSTPLNEPKRLKKIVDNLALNPSKSTHSYHSKTPPSENLVDMSVIKLIRPMKLFRLDDDNNNSTYREYLTTNFGRVRVHCQKPQPNFFSNLSCAEEIKRRIRLNNNSTASLLLRHLIDDSEQVLPNDAETEDGEIESDEENTMNINGNVSKHFLSDDDNDKLSRKKSKFTDESLLDITKSSLNEKPWMTNELRQLIKQRNKLQGQILNGDANAETEKRFRKLRNKIGKHAKMLKGKYENSISGTLEPSLAPPLNSQQSSATSAAALNAANHPLSTILDPSLVMAMLVNPSLYSHVQQQVLSNPNFMQAYQHMFAENNPSNSLPPKVASETQVVPSTSASKATKEPLGLLQQQQQNLSSARSRAVLTQATKPIQLTSLESDLDIEQRNRNKTRFNPSETNLTESQQQDIALKQELIRRQLALTQQQQRNQRNNPHAASQLFLSSPLGRHIQLTSEQMQEVVNRAKNYVTRQQSDETTDTSNTQPRLSYNTRRLQAALAASASSATPQSAHTIGQAAAAAIAAVAARPATSAVVSGPPPTMTKPVPSSSNPVIAPSASMPPPPPQQQQQHPIRIQLDQKSKTLSSISNNQSSPIPTINQQKLMPLVDVHPSPPPHMYPNQPNWQRPPHPPVAHYPMPPHPQQYPSPYDNPHGPPYYGPRGNYPPDMRPPGYGPMPPRHLSQPPRYNGPLPPPGPYGYGHPPQNYGPPPPHHPHPHYGHHYPPS